MSVVQCLKAPASAAACARTPTQIKHVLPLSRRQALLGLSGASLLILHPGAGQAVGLESVDLPELNLPQQPKFMDDLRIANQATLDAAEESFQNSKLLADLRASSEANRDKNKRDLFDKYCKRQAELGVGDCGGLRYIPGMTKSGVQKRPEWMDKLFGTEAASE